MNEQQENAQTSSERIYERCLCHEAIDRLKDLFGISEPVRQHLQNSRIELLKAVRTVLDERIEHLSRTGKQGSKIVVE